MKHALSAALVLLLALAGCAAEQQDRSEMQDMAQASDAPERQIAAVTTQSVATGSLPAADAAAAIERALRNERRLYAQGLEKILLANRVAASVRVDEDGQDGPTPALRFFGHFSRPFIQRAMTEGAVLERARALGFRSVDFFDKGPDGNVSFELSKSGPLPQCSTYNRMCL